jgi:flap endonuclease-1
MGINISEITKGREIEMANLNGRTIAIDAYNWAYQFLSIIRDRFTGEPLRDSKGAVTSHLSGLLYRTSRMIEAGIKPVYVWDGKPPEFKKYTIEERMRVRAAAKERWQAALEKGDHKEARTAAQGAIKLTKDMVEESKRLLAYMGVPSVQAPSEGEAQCSFMCKEGQVWAVASQDFDSLAFGSPKLVRNLNVTGKRKMPGKEHYIEVKPVFIELDDVLKELGVTQEQLILIGIMAGGDYAPGGIKGIGPKKALKMVQENPDTDKLLTLIESQWEHLVPVRDILDFTKNPPVEEREIPKEKLNPEKLKELMAEEHDFGAERIDKAIEKLQSFEGSKSQKGLGAFLK